MTASKAGPGRRPIDPNGDTKALTVRLPAAVKMELEAAASRNGRSISQEITARLNGPAPVADTPLVSLVEAFEERLRLFCGDDWHYREAATALAAGLPDLLRRIMVETNDPADTAAQKTGTMVAELTYDWVCTRDEPDAVALRRAFLGPAK